MVKIVTVIGGDLVPCGRVSCTTGAVINRNICGLGRHLRVGDCEIVGAAVNGNFLRRSAKDDGTRIVNQVLDFFNLYIIVAEICFDRFTRLERDIAPVAFAVQVGKNFQCDSILDVEG